MICKLCGDDEEHRRPACCKKCETNLARTWRAQNQLRYLAQNTYKHMVARCTDPKNEKFASYGRKGILVCDRWLGENGFVFFWFDMGPPPGKGWTLDRKDNSKGYYKRNCRWATLQEQNENRGGRFAHDEADPVPF